MYENKKKLSPLEQKSKMDVVKNLRDMASQSMSDRLGDLKKKVTVASDSDEGLKHGLEKAKEIVGSPELNHMVDQSEHPAGHSDDLSGDENEHQHDEYEADQAHDGAPEMDEHQEHESPEHEASESADEEASEHDDMDEDELDKKLQHLMAMKERKRSKKA